MKTRVLMVVFLIAPFFSLFFFPYPATVVLSFFAGLVFPLSALLVGALADFLYFSPPASLPVGIVIGGAVTAASFVASRFMKARLVSFD